MTSYNRALEITGCESIETTLLRMSGGRLPMRIVFGNLEGAVRRGRGGKEKEWTDGVQIVFVGIWRLPIGTGIVPHGIVFLKNMKPI